MKLKKYILFYTILFFLVIPVWFLLAPNFPGYAQNFSFAHTYVLSDPKAEIGDIIARNKKNEYVRANIALSSHTIGILSDSATIIYEENEGEGSTIVVKGITKVNVTTLNGEISPGDYIMPSPINGKGQRTSSNNGFIVGTALEAFTQKDGTTQTFNDKNIQTGSILVDVDLRPIGPTKAGAFTNLIDQMANLIFRSTQTPQQAETFFRYLLASIVAASAIAISFKAFGKNISTGIEAMGRNPLAKRQIQTAIILNTGLILLISIGGILLSLAIIKF